MHIYINDIRKKGCNWKFDKETYFLYNSLSLFKEKFGKTLRELNIIANVKGSVIIMVKRKVLGSYYKLFN